LVFLDSPLLYIREKLDLFFTIAQNDPVQAIKFVPEAAAGLGAVAVTLIAVIVGVVSLGGSAAPQKVKKAAGDAKAAASDAKDKVAEAVSTGADSAKDTVNKRSTRSTGS
jgi:calnexin